MTTIASLAEKPGKAGHGGSWSMSREDVTTNLDSPLKRVNIFHYRTLMLAYYTNEAGDWDGNVDTVYYDVGNGSVSDQNGMNKLFHRLDMPFYYGRAGGAQIS